MKTYKLAWRGMNGCVHTIKADSLKEAKIKFLDRLDEPGAGLEDVMVVK